MSRALDPDSPISALGDAPREEQARELGNLLYALHLAILLYWFHDRTLEAQATRELVGSARDALRYLRPALRFPPLSRVLSRIADALGNVGMNATGSSAGGPKET